MTMSENIISIGFDLLHIETVAKSKLLNCTLLDDSSLLSLFLSQLEFVKNNISRYTSGHLINVRQIWTVHQLSEIYLLFSVTFAY